MGEEPGKVTPGTVVPGEPLTLWGGWFIVHTSRGLG